MGGFSSNPRLSFPPSPSYSPPFTPPLSVRPSKATLQQRRVFFLSPTAPSVSTVLLSFPLSWSSDREWGPPTPWRPGTGPTAVTTACPCSPSGPRRRGPTSSGPGAAGHERVQPRPAVPSPLGRRGPRRRSRRRRRVRSSRRRRTRVDRRGGRSTARRLSALEIVKEGGSGSREKRKGGGAMRRSGEGDAGGREGEEKT